MRRRLVPRASPVPPGLVAAAIALAAALVSGPVISARAHPALDLRLVQLPNRTVHDLAVGRFLVAQTGLVDPNFNESVVLLIDHDKKGSAGLILNRRTNAPLSSVLNGARGRGADNLVFFGGPVEEPGGVMALLRSKRPRQGTKHVFADVYLVLAPELLSSLIADGTGPDRFRVFVGYSGWSAGQLERETRQGAWKVVNGVGSLVFDPDPSTLWSREKARAGERAVSLPVPSSSAPG